MGNAWDGKPGLDSLDRLQQVAEQSVPLIEQVNVLLPVYYGTLFRISDNFADDEIASTVFVMALALLVAFVLGRSLGFWVRRGRPGIVASILYGVGARVFKRWYTRNAPYAMSGPLYATTRTYVQRELVEDPRAGAGRGLLPPTSRLLPPSGPWQWIEHRAE